MNKKLALGLFCILIASTATAQSITIDKPVSNDGEISALELPNLTVSGTTTNAEAGYIEVTVTDNASNQAYRNITWTGNTWNTELDVSGLNDGTLDLKAELTNKTAKVESYRIQSDGGNAYGGTKEVIEFNPVDGTRIAGYSFYLESGAWSSYSGTYTFENLNTSTVIESSSVTHNEVNWQNIEFNNIYSLNGSDTYRLTIPADIHHQSTKIEPIDIGPFDITRCDEQGENLANNCIAFGLIESKGQAQASATVEKDSSYNYNLSSDATLEWNFNDRKTVFRDDRVEDAYTVHFYNSEGADYVNISNLNIGEIFSYSEDSYTFENKSINVSNMSVGENRSKTFDLYFEAIPQEFWDSMRENATNEAFRVDIYADSVDNTGETEGFYTFTEYRDLNVAQEGIIPVIRRAISGFFDSILDVLNPVFNVVSDIFNWLIDAVVFAISFIIDILVVVLSTILQIVLEIVGTFLTIGGNVLQYILFYHTDIAYEYNNTTYSSMEEADIGFLDAISGNFNVKHNTTMQDYFNGGVIADNPSETSLVNHNNRYTLYEYNLTSIENQENQTEVVPE